MGTIVLTDEEEKFMLRLRHLAKGKTIDHVTVRIPDLAIVEKWSRQEEVFRPHQAEHLPRPS